jgi:hypothetical protein
MITIKEQMPPGREGHGPLRGSVILSYDRVETFDDVDIALFVSHLLDAAVIAELSKGIARFPVDEQDCIVEVSSAGEGFALVSRSVSGTPYGDALTIGASFKADLANALAGPTHVKRASDALMPGSLLRAYLRTVCPAEQWSR